MIDQPITQLEEPKSVKYRETHIDYTESLGEAYKSLSIETDLTAEEIMQLVDKMMGGTSNDGFNR